MPPSPSGPRKPPIWYRPGLSPGKTRILNGVLALLLVGFGAGWIWGLTLEATEGSVGVAGRLTANPLSGEAPPEAAYLLDAAVRRFASAEVPLRGRSGAVRVVVPEPGEAVPFPDSLPEGVGVEVRPVPSEPGLRGFLVHQGRASRWVPDLAVLSPVPISRKRDGRIGTYLIGSWPFEGGGTPPSDAYRTPTGLVEVTRENRDLPLSDHFVLGDFLTKGQEDVWPKYVALSTRLLDKLELTLQELERMGHPVERVGVISGFRTPHYNVGGGDPSGRGSLSRHMYGDAMDFYIDNDGDGRMDDLDGDGRVDVADARVLARAAETVEANHPELIGGIGVYSPTGAHSGFVHVDTRGYRARW